jgi:hypothetical protein
MRETGTFGSMCVGVEQSTSLPRSTPVVSVRSAATPQPGQFGTGASIVIGASTQVCLRSTVVDFASKTLSNPESRTVNL